jgi:hypothetical protein
MNGGLRIAYILGELMAFSSGINSDDDFELLVKYGFSILYHSWIGLYVQSEVRGIITLTQEGNFNDRSFHTYKVGLGYKFDSFGIGLSYKDYMDDFISEEFNGILGIKLNLFL